MQYSCYFSIFFLVLMVIQEDQATHICTFTRKCDLSKTTEFCLKKAIAM